MPAKGQISITNLNGEELFRRQVTAPKTVVDVSSLASGVYFLKYSDERTVQVGKFIKY